MRLERFTQHELADIICEHFILLLLPLHMYAYDPSTNLPERNETMSLYYYARHTLIELRTTKFDLQQFNKDWIGATLQATSLASIPVLLTAKHGPAMITARRAAARQPCGGYLLTSYLARLAPSYNHYGENRCDMKGPKLSTRGILSPYHSGTRELGILPSLKRVLVDRDWGSTKGDGEGKIFYLRAYS